MNLPEGSIYWDLLTKTAKALDEAGIPYVVIGGQAVLLHGEVRLTQDIDVTLGITPDRVGDLLAVASSAKLDVITKEPAEFVRTTYVLPCQDRNSKVRVDFIFSLTPFNQQAIDHAETVDVKGHGVKFAKLEDLLGHKIIAGRSRDIDDAKRLINKHPNADFAHVRHWREQFDEVTGKSLMKQLDEILKELK